MLTAARVGGRRLLSTAAATETVELPVKLFGIHARYASAAFVAASKAKSLDTVESELLAFKSVMAKNATLASLVENPTIPREKKVAQVGALLGNKTSYVTKNTLVTLAANARLGEVDKVIDAYATLMKAHRKEVDAIVTSAEPLTKKQHKSVTEALGKHVDPDQKVIISTKVDPSILGGLTIQIGDKFLDLSASSKIGAIQRAL
eukprot:CAMPEP_0197414594 /NCGR_PEP_ID=MMETSP1170-20131217/1280_1 /TAXON_ID=54406 /ORGANISM="Sarcinochrysis sp, Strain CCMP770" /LENGTH=203 /DNA_ID=CAMNT_0042941317 /DNA_START=49 /DNA_END=660 /DNA_ORIENTATION=-